MTMKEEIEKFKKNNGNDSFSQKEMIMYLVHKIDKIDERFEIGTGKIAQNRSDIASCSKRVDDILKYGIGCLITILSGFAGVIAWLVNKIK